MKTIKYNPIGTAAKELNEYIQQCHDEHSAEINRLCERHALDKKLRTDAENQAAVNMALEYEREIRNNEANRVLEILAGKRMGDKEMKKSLESKKRTAKANRENATKPRPRSKDKPKPSKADLENFKNNWEYEHGTPRGWIKSASNHYNYGTKTISEIYREK